MWFHKTTCPLRVYFPWTDIPWVYPCLAHAFVFYQVKTGDLSSTESTLFSWLSRMIGNPKCFHCLCFLEKSFCLSLCVACREEHAEDQVHKIGFWDSGAQNGCQLFSRKHKLFHRALKLIQLNITSALNRIKMLKGQRTFCCIYYTDVILLHIVLGHDLRSLDPWKTIQVTSDSFWSSYTVLPSVYNELQNQTMFQTKIPSNCSVLTESTGML